MHRTFPISRRVILLAIAAAAGLGLVTQALMREAPATRPEPLSVALVPSPLSLPVAVAHEHGFFRAQGLAVTALPYVSGKEALDALLRGEVEVAAVAETPIVRRSFDSAEFRVIATMAHSYGSNEVVARADRGIRTAADLRRRRIGVPHGTSVAFFLHALLVDHGVQPAEVTAVHYAAPELEGALLQGTVDAIAGYQPFTTAVAAKLPAAQRTILQSDRVRVSFSYVVPRALPERKAEALRRLLLATDHAIGWLGEHPEEARAHQARRSGVPMTAGELAAYTYRLSLDQTLLISLEEQARWALRTGQVSAEGIPNYLEYLSLAPLTAAKPSAITLIH